MDEKTRDRKYFATVPLKNESVRNGTPGGEGSIPVHISIVLPHSFFKEKDYLKEINSGKKIFSKMKFQVGNSDYSRLRSRLRTLIFLHR